MKNRINSIDILRGIIILLMMFVNDLAGVQNVPQCLAHAPWGTNWMTVPDVVFPAFLFIVGMSMPFAFDNRLARGESKLSIIKHIFRRSMNLIIIGILMVNTNSISWRFWFPAPVWILLMYISVIFIWNRIPRDNEKLAKLFSKLKYVGIAILIVLVFLYRNDNINSLIEIRTGWWGILGLIGWAYLVSALIYIGLNGKFSKVMFAMWLMCFFYFACAAGFLSEIKFFSPGSIFGSHGAIILMGALLGIIIRRYHHESKIQCLKSGFMYSLGLLVAGLLLNQLSPVSNMFYIDKLLGTPVWGLISASITIWIWMIIYFITDVKGKISWAKFIEPAGMNPLFAYILAPIIEALFLLFNYVTGIEDIYGILGQNFYIGLFRSIFFALFITWLTGYFKKKNIWLKL